MSQALVGDVDTNGSSESEESDVEEALMNVQVLEDDVESEERSNPLNSSSESSSHSETTVLLPVFHLVIFIFLKQQL